MFRNGALCTKQNLSNAHEFVVCLVYKTFMNFASITYTVFSLPSADFVAVVKNRQIRQRANYSSRTINHRSLDNEFVYILYFASYMNAHTNICLQYHVAVETMTNSSDEEVFLIIFRASDRKLL